MVSLKEKTVAKVATMAFLVEFTCQRLGTILLTDTNSVTSISSPLMTRQEWKSLFRWTYMLTKLKVRLIWSSRPSATKVIFFLNRYISFVTAAMAIIGVCIHLVSNNVVSDTNIAIVTDSDYGVRDRRDLPYRTLP